MKGVSRIFKLRANTAEDFTMWTYKLMKNIEKSKGRRYDLGVDEKRLAVNSWKVGFYNAYSVYYSSIKSRRNRF